MPPSAPTGNRNERRRAATRQALVRAARQILTEGDEAGVSIQVIAERADVGFGSFYNHFTSKAELFAVTVVEAMEEFGQAFDEGLAGVRDPAELVSGGFRLAARMASTNPEVMQVVRRRALGFIHDEQGFAPRALRDVELGIDRGRFTPVDPVAALSVMAGSLVALIELRFARPEMDGDAVAISTAEMVLRMLGLSHEDAAEVARRPLPEVDPA